MSTSPPRKSPVLRSWRAGATLPFPTVPAPNITPLPSLTTLTLNVVDVVNRNYNLVTPTTVIFDALNPTTAENISNYSLINTSENDADESAYISHAQPLSPWPPLLRPTGRTFSITTDTST